MCGCRRPLLKSQSPHHEQTLAPRGFYLNRHALAPRVFYLNRYALEHYAMEQALAPMVFDLNHHASEMAVAPRIFRLNRSDLAPRIFHLNLHVVGQALAPDGHSHSSIQNRLRKLYAFGDLCSSALIRLLGSYITWK